MELLGTCCAVALALLALSQWWKVLPFAYHVRVVCQLLSSLTSSSLASTLADVVVVSRHRVSVSDMDWNMHQNNSCYPLEADVARYSFFVRLLRTATSTRLRSTWRIANGGVSTYFLRELRWGTRYDIHTRVAGHDAKWLYLISAYVPPGRDARAAPYAVLVTRIVFKERSGKTAPPREVLLSLGYAERDVAAFACDSGTGGGAAGDGGDASCDARFCGPAMTAIIERLVSTSTGQKDGGVKRA